ncbi:MAG: hemolysin XhlA family protein [Firmicutes bacterium]|nr:hemolysin XhlA family protein [Bacillota bacterium]
MVVSNKAVLREQAATSEGEDDRMDWQEKYFQKLDENVNDLKIGLQQLGQRVDAVYQRIDTVNQRLDSVIQQLSETNKWVMALVVTTILSVVGLATGLLPVR